MRPTIVRPDLGEINDRFDAGIDGASSGPGDRPSPQRTRVLKRLVLTTYQQLMDMTNDNITHSDWAWSMRVVVETSLRDIMQLGIIRYIFDLVYSLFCGCVGAPVPSARLDKYSPQYGSYQTTFKDAYGIVCGYFKLFKHDEKKLKKFCAQHDQDTALQIVLDDLEKEKPPLEDEEALETVRQLRNNFWKDTKAVYYQLKNEGRETFDFDVVFDNEEPPFPDHVFMSIAGWFFTAHGWLPVGDNVGLFKDERMSHEVAKPNPPLMARLQAAFTYLGNPPNQWQDWWNGLDEEAQILVHDTMYMTEPGILSLAAHRSPAKVEEQLIEMFPEAKTLTSGVRKFVALHFHVANTLVPNLMLHLRDYHSCSEGYRFNNYNLKDPRGGDIRLDLHTCFGEMMIKKFGMGVFVKDGKLGDVTDPTSSGKVVGLPFQSLVSQIHRASTFCFLRELLTNYNPTHVNKGIFFQACVDYANKHDPIEWHDEDDDWVLWLATTIDHPLIINDKRLFMSPLPLDKKEVRIMGRVYQVTEKGTICYAYNRKGQGIYSAAYYCKQTEVNLLNENAFLRLLGSVKRDYDTSLLELPRLKAEETLEGLEKVSWRGYELKRVDLTYWHKQLGHVSRRTLKRYQKVINGIPPYFWSEKVDCECL